ncbi:MAG: hypothetical protein QNJ65_15585 [Xenococcaceae cyanobacterium MO_234.B1]|nr:hypothetical protein [Xenococcaceae cyanobacterium MO_234.B1]
MSELVCEALATKAELQELRDQINQLLGKQEDGSVLNVLGLGSFEATTIIGGTVLLAKESIKEIELAGTVADDIGKALADGSAQWVKVKGSGAKTPLPDLTSVSKNTAAKASIGVKGAKVAASTAALVSTVATMVASVGLTIATVEILGSRIDGVEKDQLQRDKDYTNLINILSRNNQDIDTANADIQELQQALSEQSTINSELLSEIEDAQGTIEELTANAEKQQQEFNKLEESLADLKQEIADYQAQSIQSIDDLQTTINVLETDLTTAKTNIDFLFETIETLSTNLAEQEAKVTEQGVKIESLELTSSVQIAELINLKIAVEQNQDLTDARLDSLEAKLVLGNRQISRGGGVSSATKSAIAEQQNKTLELVNNLAGNPVEELPDITYSQIANNNSPFTDLFNQILPQISLGTGGDLNVNVDELSTRLNDDFTQTLTTLGIVGLTDTVNDIRNQTTAQAISQAAETAICNSTAPNGCMAKDIKEPIVNGQNSLRDNITNFIQGLDIFQGQQILNTVTENNGLLKNAEFGLESISNFMKTAWRATRMDKVLNILNTIFALHNAAMLSRNLAQTVGDVATQALQFLNIKDADDNFIDVNEVIGNTFETWINNLIGAETYQNIQQTWRNLNRIMVAGQGVIYSIQGVKNAVLEGVETVGQWTAKIGNNMIIQGLFEERSFPWMDENVNFRNPFQGFIQKINTTEEIVSQVSNLVASGTEAQENFNQIFEQSSELKTASQKLQENLSNFDSDKETTEAQEVANSASPDIDRLDLIQLEPDEI